MWRKIKYTILFIALLSQTVFAYDGDAILDNVQPEGGGTLDVDTAIIHDITDTIIPYSSSGTMTDSPIGTDGTHILPSVTETTNLGSATYEYEDMYLNNILYGGAIQFDTVWVPGAHSEGQMHWNSDCDALEVDMVGGNVNLQIGFETLLPRRARNESGVDIKNGEPVYVTGGSGNNIYVAQADASTLATARVVGLATEDIDNNNYGWVATYGIVRGETLQPIDTSSWAAGTILFLSETTGEWTNVMPDAPAINVVIGFVFRQHATEGAILLNPFSIPPLSYLSDVQGRGTETDDDGVFWDDGNSRYELSARGNPRTGWPSTRGVTLSFDDGTRTFTVTDGGSGYYFIQGERYALGGNKTVVIDDTAGLWFIYFSGDTLTASQTPWNIKSNDKALVGYVLWDAVNNKSIFTGWELHTYVLDEATHYFLHHSIGTLWDANSGGLLVSDTGSDTINVSAGDIHDEDNEIEITDGAGGGLWEQVLTPAELPVYYQTGSSPVLWNIIETADKNNATDVGYVSGTDLQYNELNVATWQLTNVPSANYMAMWIYATNELNEPVVAIMGQRTDSTLAQARSNNTPASLVLDSNLAQESVLLSRVIIKETGSGLYYTIEEVTDYRGANLAGGTTIVGANDHGTLSGLSDDDHPIYALLAGRTGGQELFGSDTTAETLTLTNNSVDNISLEIGSNFTFGSNLIIPDAGYIGSASDTDAIQIEADGDVVLTQDLSVTGNISAGSTSIDGTTANTFTVNNDLTDTTAQLILGRTTGGNATFGWDGSTVSLDNDIIIHGGRIYVGVDGSQVGDIILYGNTTGIAEGGTAFFHTADDYDTTYAYYYMQAYQDDFIISRSGNTDFWIYSTGDVGITNNLYVPTIKTSSGNLEIQPDGQYIDFKYNAAAGGIIFIDSDNNVDGYVYASGGEIGFLDDDGNWAYSVETDTDHSWWINTAKVMDLTTSALTFATAQTITTSAGDLTLNPTGNVVSSKDLYVSTIKTASGNLEIQPDGQYIDFKYNAAAGGIIFIDSDNNVDGYVYASGETIGFLDADGQWAYQITTDTDHEWLINNSTKMLLDVNGSLYIGDTSNANMTTGLTINQGTDDDEILTLKSSVVGHSMTAQTEADTYFTVTKSTPGGGGTYIRTLTDNDTSPFVLYSMFGTTNPTDTKAAILLGGWKSDGSTNVTSLAASERVLEITNAASTLWYIEGDGDVTMAGALKTSSGNLEIQPDGQWIDFKYNGAEGGIKFRDSDNNVDGYVYGAGATIGFLDTDLEWAYQITTDTDHEWRINGSIVMTLTSSALTFATAQTITTSAGDLTLDAAGDVIITGGISSEDPLSISNATLNTTDTYYNIYAYTNKTAGVTDASDNYWGVYAYARMDQSGGVIGDMGGIFAVGNVVTGTADNIFGIWATSNTYTGATVTQDMIGVSSGVTVNASSTVTGSVYGMLNSVAASSDPGVTTYGYFLTMSGYADWGFYQLDSTPNYFGGSLSSDFYIGREQSSDPGNPAEGEYVLWQSDGTGSGDDGDIMIKITAGATTKTITLVDFSAF